MSCGIVFGAFGGLGVAVNFLFAVFGYQEVSGFKRLLKVDLWVDLPCRSNSNRHSSVHCLLDFLLGEKRTTQKLLAFHDRLVRLLEPKINLQARYLLSF